MSHSQVTGSLRADRAGWGHPFRAPFPAAEPARAADAGRRSRDSAWAADRGRTGDRYPPWAEVDLPDDRADDRADDWADDLTDLRPSAALRGAVRVEVVAPRRPPLWQDGRARVGLHLTLAALPLLAISAHVFGLLPMHLSAGLIVVPLLVVVAVLAVFDPRREERVILHGVLWGVVATVVYDAVRLDTAYLLGLWGDFIPTVGTWIMGADPDAQAGGAVVGYLWRYVGDGGGIGLTFFVLAATTGLWRLSSGLIVAASVVFAVFPVWAGLIATVALAPRGQSLMFPLTPTTVSLSLLGHLVFGLVLGLGCVRSRRVATQWPWAPLVEATDLVEGRPLRPAWATRTPVRARVAVSRAPGPPSPPAGLPRAGRVSRPPEALSWGGWPVDARLPRAGTSTPSGGWPASPGGPSGARAARRPPSSGSLPRMG